MTSKMQAVFYRDAHGKEPVDDFIESLSLEEQVQIDFTIGLLNRLRPSDPPLPFPFSSQIEGQFRELRSHYGRKLLRIIYRRSENLFVLLHAFEKRSAKIPEREKEIAWQRWDDFRQRMDARPRKGPRPAGRDAP